MNKTFEQWITNYITEQKKAIDSIPVEKIKDLINKLAEALKKDRQIFILGNGGSAANATPFAGDLGKSSSDATGRRFKVLTLNDNMSWLTALGNDYTYEDVFVGQLQNYAKPKDICIAISASGNSPNVVKTLVWAKKHQLQTIAIVGGKKGKLAEIADHTIVIDSTHVGRIEDASMTALHLLCYAFIEHPEWAKIS